LGEEAPCNVSCGRYVSNPEFDPSLVKNASKACEGICKWVRALDIYDRVIKVVAPKKIKLTEAEAELDVQMTKLNQKRDELKMVCSRRIKPKFHLTRHVTSRHAILNI